MVDKRFSAMFNDESFQDKAAVDRYGRSLPKSKQSAAKGQPSETVDRMFRMQDDDAPDVTGSSSAQRQSKEKSKKKKKGAKMLEQPRDKAEVEDDDDEEEGPGYSAVQPEEDLSDDDGDELAEEEEEEEEEEADTESATSSDDDDDEAAKDGEVPSALVNWLEGAEHVPRVSDSTSRLAVCNCDWDSTRAVDLYAVLRSFLPKGARILNVAVYPSDFGEQRMAEEATVGPVALLDQPRGDGDDDVDDDEDRGEEDAEVVNENLRRYELDRLKYYFGVVTCDSVATADALYAECDGAEFEASSLPLDLRFIPEDMAFPKVRVRVRVRARVRARVEGYRRGLSFEDCVGCGCG